MTLRSVWRAVVPSPVRDRINRYWNLVSGRYSRRSYAQEGEDLILLRVFERQATGFYVDIGAHHPLRFSNTYAFYRLGWRGINVDAMPGSMVEFEFCRPRDINLEVPVSETPQLLVYHAFAEPALNGFSTELSTRRAMEHGERLLWQRELRTSTLAELLEHHLPPGQAIDFLSVDVEGLDEAVLRSNDWSRFRPTVVLVEILGSRMDGIHATAIGQLLAAQGYEAFAKTVNSVFFRLHALERVPEHR